MKKIIFPVLFLLLGILYFDSCKQDTATLTPPKPRGPTLYDLLAGKTDKKWKLTKYLVNDSDATAGYDSCFLDNIYDFKRDYSYKVNEGDSLCNALDSSVYDWGSWLLDNSKNSITIISTKYSDTTMSNILELNSLKMRISRTDTTISKKYEYDFTAQ